MKRISLWSLTTVTALGLLLGYHTSGGPEAPAVAIATTQTTAGQTGTGQPATGSAAAAAGSGAASGTSGSGTTGAGTSGSTAPTGTAATSTGLTDGTYIGTAVSTRWGPVQVKLTVAGGRITSAEAVEYPTANGRDQQINSVAIPYYEQAAVAAQSAKIDHVSGATVTWQGYTGSLQSALDQARKA